MSVDAQKRRTPPEYVLYRATQFSRRMANYLYLPIFLICLLVFLFALVGTIEDGTAFWSRENSYASGMTGLGAVSFALWRFARQPRPNLLLVQGILLASLAAAWIGWFLYALVFGRTNFGLTPLGIVGAIGSLLWFFVVAVSMGSAAATSIRYWREWRHIPRDELREAIDRAEKHKPRFMEVLANAPVQSVEFAAGSIFLLPPEQVEPAPPEEIEAGLWKEEWVVIAVEQPDGKPIYMDTTAENDPVYLARREPESWHHTRVADSVGGFLEALKQIAEMNEAEKVGIGNRWLGDGESERILAAIERANPGAEMWFWKRLTIPPE